MYKVVSFSGGKDSTALLLKMIEKDMNIDEIIFADTGIEFPEMYEHIDKVEEYINRPITRIKSEYDFEYYMFDRVKSRGKNKGKKGYSWPTFFFRWCTGRLKQDVFRKYLKQFNNVIEYHGISYEERERTERNNDRNILYPLVEWKMTGEDNLQYCYKKGFDWGGLYEKFHRVSCYLCPLQRISELRVVYQDYPDLWEYMKELDNRTINIHGFQFRNDYSIRDLEEKFKAEG